MRDEILPFCLPDLDESELEELKRVLESGWITTGPKTHEFEQQFANMAGAKAAVAVNSCTAALHLALEAIGLSRGDRVITTPYTFAATSEVVRYFDATPVFVDVDADTLNISPIKLAERLEEFAGGARGPVKAIIPVHIAGHPCDLGEIGRLANKYSVIVVEDAAHAFPAQYEGHPIGSMAYFPSRQGLACFSFYATKTITTGEGGMITTHDEDLATRCRLMSLHGISKDAWKRYSTEGDWYYEITAPGFKYNMTDLSAALGLAQLRKAERMRARRLEIARAYDVAFSSLPQFQTPSCRTNVQHAWHLYLLRLNLEKWKIDRNQFMVLLKERNIGASVHFIPLHLHPYYRDTFGYRAEDFPVAFREYQRVVSLPIYSRMTQTDVEDVVEAVQSIAGAYSTN